jgi:MFS superfamily sulfate permease-like transporter
MRGAFAGTAAAFGIYSAVLAGFVAALFGSTAI